MEAVWLDADKKDHAQAMGYTVVYLSRVIATHINKIMQRHAHELLEHEEVQNLLQEAIPIRDVRTIAEALAEAGTKSQDPDSLAA